MNIQPKGYTLELSYDEMWNLAWSVRRDIEQDIKSHYIHHQDAFERNEQTKLNTLRELFNYLGRVDLYEDIFKVKEGAFKNFNDKNNGKD